jgi:16S rRNA processing protein RimM
MPVRDAPRRVCVGVVLGAFGVRGWVKVRSFTDPEKNILNYSLWHLEMAGDSRPIRPLQGHGAGQGWAVQLEGIEDRDAAVALRGNQIFVERSLLSPLPAGQYYWADLVGLAVHNEQDVELGVIEDMMETGANDVMIVRGEREHLVPFVMGQYVKAVDLEQGFVRVDWDPEF